MATTPAASSTDAPSAERINHHEAVVKKLLVRKDEFSLEDAKEAVEAIEELWFNRVPQDIARYESVPERLLLLANGLRQGALNDVLIEPRLYCTFVVSFLSRMQEHAENGKEPISKDGEDLIQLIKRAYRVATWVDPGNPVLAAPFDDLKEVACAGIEMFKNMLQGRIDHFNEAMMQQRQLIFGNSGPGFHGWISRL